MQYQLSNPELDMHIKRLIVETLGLQVFLTTASAELLNQIAPVLLYLNRDSNATFQMENSEKHKKAETSIKVTVFDEAS